MYGGYKSRALGKGTSHQYTDTNLSMYKICKVLTTLILGVILVRVRDI